MQSFKKIYSVVMKLNHFFFALHVFAFTWPYCFSIQKGSLNYDIAINFNAFHLSAQKLLSKSILDIFMKVAPIFC